MEKRRGREEKRQRRKRMMEVIEKTEEGPREQRQEVTASGKVKMGKRWASIEGKK